MTPPSDPNLDVVERHLDGRLRLVHYHAHAADGRPAQARLRDALGEGLDEIHGFADDEAVHGVGHLPVVDRVGQVVRVSGGREVEVEPHVDRERLTLLAFVGEDSVMPDAGDPERAFDS